jgi:hypothetical protein
VQVSRQELLAARVIELGLARLLQGKSFECDFPASLAAALQTFAIASRPNGFVVQDRHRPRWFFPPSEPQCSTRKGSRLVQADTAVQHGRFIPRQKGGLKAIGHNSRH